MSGIADPFYGHTDEFRTHNLQRSDGWIANTWNNMSDPGAFAAGDADERKVADLHRCQVLVRSSASWCEGRSISIGWDDALLWTFNTTPRKCLAFQIPMEAFARQLGVALET